MPPAHCPVCQAYCTSIAAIRTFNRLSQPITIPAAIAFGVFGVLEWQVGKAKHHGGKSDELNVWSRMYCGSIPFHRGLRVPMYDSRVPGVLPRA